MSFPLFALDAVLLIRSSIIVRCWRKGCECDGTEFIPSDKSRFTFFARHLADALQARMHAFAEKSLDHRFCWFFRFSLVAQFSIPLFDSAVIPTYYRWQLDLTVVYAAPCVSP